MKKKLVIGGLAIAALTTGGFLLSESRAQAYDFTPTQISNLEALSGNETPGVVSCSECKNSVCFVYSGSTLTATYHDKKRD